MAALCPSFALLAAIIALPAANAQNNQTTVAPGMTTRTAWWQAINATWSVGAPGVDTATRAEDPAPNTPAPSAERLGARSSSTRPPNTLPPAATTVRHNNGTTTTTTPWWMSIPAPDTGVATQPEEPMRNIPTDTGGRLGGGSSGTQPPNTYPPMLGALPDDPILPATRSGNDPPPQPSTPGRLGAPTTTTTRASVAVVNLPDFQTEPGHIDRSHNHAPDPGRMGATTTTTTRLAGTFFPAPTLNDTVSQHQPHHVDGPQHLPGRLVITTAAPVQMPDIAYPPRDNMVILPEVPIAGPILDRTLRPTTPAVSTTLRAASTTRAFVTVTVQPPQHGGTVVQPTPISRPIDVGGRWGQSTTTRPVHHVLFGTTTWRWIPPPADENWRGNTTWTERQTESGDIHFNVTVPDIGRMRLDDQFDASPGIHPVVDLPRGAMVGTLVPTTSTSTSTRRASTQRPSLASTTTTRVGSSSSTVGTTLTLPRTVPWPGADNTDSLVDMGFGIGDLPHSSIDRMRDSEVVNVAKPAGTLPPRTSTSTSTRPARSTTTGPLQASQSGLIIGLTTPPPRLSRPTTTATTQPASSTTPRSRDAGRARVITTATAPRSYSRASTAQPAIDGVANKWAFYSTTSTLETTTVASTSTTAASTQRPNLASTTTTRLGSSSATVANTQRPNLASTTTRRVGSSSSTVARSTTLTMQGGHEQSRAEVVGKATPQPAFSRTTQPRATPPHKDVSAVEKWFALTTAGVVEEIQVDVDASFQDLPLEGPLIGRRRKALTTASPSAQTTPAHTRRSTRAPQAPLSSFSSYDENYDEDTVGVRPSFESPNMPSGEALLDALPRRRRRRRPVENATTTAFIAAGPHEDAAAATRTVATTTRRNVAASTSTTAGPGGRGESLARVATTTTLRSTTTAPYIAGLDACRARAYFAQGRFAPSVTAVSRVVACLEGDSPACGGPVAEAMREAVFPVAASEELVQRLRRAWQRTFVRRAAALHYGSCGATAVSQEQRNGCVGKLARAEQALGLEVEAPASLAETHAQREVLAALQCCAGRAEECLAAAKKAGRLAGMRPRDFSAVQQGAAVRAAAEHAASCKAGGGTQDVCLASAKDEFLRLTGAKDLGDDVARRISLLSVALAAGTAIVRVPRSQVEAVAVTDGSICVTRLEEWFGSTMLQRAKRDHGADRATRAAGTACSLRYGSAEYRAVVQVNASDEEVDRIAEQLAAGLAGARMGGRRLQASAAGVSVVEVYANQVVDECAETDWPCREGEAPRSGSAAAMPGPPTSGRLTLGASGGAAAVPATPAPALTRVPMTPVPASPGAAATAQLPASSSLPATSTTWQAPTFRPPQTPNSTSLSPKGAAPGPSDEPSEPLSAALRPNAAAALAFILAASWL